MKAPEMTEEIQRDLELLKMRSVLDPKRHYKNNDMKVLPKHFHIGTVVDSPVDFYASRIPKKSRKRTLAEEILSNEESLRYAFYQFQFILDSSNLSLIGVNERKKEKEKISVQKFSYIISRKIHVTVFRTACLMQIDEQTNQKKYSNHFIQTSHQLRLHEISLSWVYL